jgi:hypothetical protein
VVSIVDRHHSSIRRLPPRGNQPGGEFALLAADQDLAGTGLDKALYRPGAFEFDMNGNRHRIQLSWEDGLRHKGVVITWKR